MLARRLPGLLPALEPAAALEAAAPDLLDRAARGQGPPLPPECLGQQGSRAVELLQAALASRLEARDQPKQDALRQAIEA